MIRGEVFLQWEEAERSIRESETRRTVVVGVDLGEIGSTNV